MEEIKKFKQYLQEENKNENTNTTGVFIIKNNKIIFQESNYIEHGWYVEMIDDDITLWEIPYGGGEEIRVGGYHDLLSAINAGMKLT